MKCIYGEYIKSGGKAAGDQQKSCIDEGDIMTTMEKYNLGVFIF